MKLLLVSVKSKISVGGIATWTDQFMERSNSHGIKCYLVNTEVVGIRATQGTAKRRFADEYIRTKRIFKDLNRLLKTEELDAAHLNTSCGTFGLFRDYIIAWQIKRRNISLTTHYHCDIPYWVSNPVSRKCLGALARLSDNNLVLCESSREFLEKNYGLYAEKIPNFIEENYILDLQKEAHDKIERIFYAGRITKEKGVAELYELAKRFPQIQFELAGEIAKEVYDWEKPSNVSLLGVITRHEIIEHLDQADLFVFPSYSEGFSQSLMESMARGVPAIATNVGANMDMLNDGRGIIVQQGDIAGMESAIYMLQDINIRKKMSRKSVEKVRNEYGMDIVMARLKSMYERRGVHEKAGITD